MITDIARLCREASYFQAKRNWQLKAPCVISWEFADIGEFHAARADLMREILTADAYLAMKPSQIERVVSPHMVELDCCGVTFRLVCLAIMDTQHGPKGAMEVNMISKPSGWWKTGFGLK